MTKEQRLENALRTLLRSVYGFGRPPTETETRAYNAAWDEAQKVLAETCGGAETR